MAADYLNFGDAVRLDKLQDISKIQPDMMDCSRYEAEFDLSEEESKSNLCLVMDYISDPAEVTINRLNCGMRISPSWNTGENVTNCSRKLQDRKKRIGIFCQRKEALWIIKHCTSFLMDSLC